jgi:hypothetical protein
MDIRILQPCPLQPASGYIYELEAQWRFGLTFAVRLLLPRRHTALLFLPMATLTTSSRALYANTSASPSFSCSTGCQYITFPLPDLASWTAVDASLPILRETQFVVDPNYNTTSTSVRCNTAALSAYRTVTLGGPEYYGLDGDCNLIAMYGRSHAATVYASL